MNWPQPPKSFKSSQKNPRILHTPPRQKQPPIPPQQQKSKRNSNPHSSPKLPLSLSLPPNPQPNPLSHPLLNSSKQCPYHFSIPTHICLSCRKSICLRCAITYCQQHTIHPQGEILPLLQIDLEKLTIEPRVEEIQLRLRQARQREDYLKRKIERVLQQVEESFQTVARMLERKKIQVLDYFRQQLIGQMLGEYKKYQQLLEQKLCWLKTLQQTLSSFSSSAPSPPSPSHFPSSSSPSPFPLPPMSIQQLDQLALTIKKQIPNTETLLKNQLKINKYILGKDKIKMNTLWSEECLEKILWAIESVEYRLEGGNGASSGKKKRINTEVSDFGRVAVEKGDREKDKDKDKGEKGDRVGPVVANFHSGVSNNNSNNNSNSKNVAKNPFASMLNSGINSKFSSGKKNQY